MKALQKSKISAPPSAPSKLKVTQANLPDDIRKRLKALKRVKAHPDERSNALLGVSLPKDLKERIRLAALSENRSMANFCVTYLTRVLEERGF